MGSDKELFKSSPHYLDDCNIYWGKSKVYHLYPLSQSYAAQNIQEQLEELYLYKK